MVRYGFNNYIEYIRDNPKGYWFKRKLYGWGWVPVRREGWAVILGFVVGVLIDGFYLDSVVKPSGYDFGLFFGVLVFLILGLIWVCYRTGEKPKWTWGK